MKLRALLISRDPQFIRSWSIAAYRSAVDADLASDSDMLHWLKNEKYETVILDARMLAASQAIEWVRTSPSSKTAVLLAVSEREQMQSLISAGVSAVVPAPIGAESAVEVLRATYPEMRRDRRHYVRFDVHQEARVLAGDQRFDSSVSNISQFGLSLQACAPIRVHSLIRVEYALPDGTSVACNGKVVWSRSNGRAGVRLIQAPPESQQAIRQWLDERLDAALQLSDKVVTS